MKDPFLPLACTASGSLYKSLPHPGPLLAVAFYDFEHHVSLGFLSFLFSLFLNTGLLTKS